MNDITKKRGRGLGKKLAMFCTSIRIDRDTFEFFKSNYPKKPLSKMREVLAAYVKTQGDKHDQAVKQNATHPQADQEVSVHVNKGGSTEGTSSGESRASSEKHGAQGEQGEGHHGR